MVFQNVPQEIADSIFHGLPAIDLLAVSLTCQRFRRVVEPILYSTFVQTKGAAIPMFLRTILEKPYLAQYVKSFAATESQSHAYLLREHHRKTIETHLSNYFKDKNSKKGFGLDDWVYAMYRSLCNFGGLAAFVLLLLPNIETIILREFKDDDREWIFSLLAEASKIQRQDLSLRNEYSLCKLKTLSINTHPKLGPPARVLYGTINTLLDIPSLRSLSCHGMAGIPWVTSQCISSILELSLTDCDFTSASYIQQLLSRCRILKVLRFQYSSFLYSRPNHSPFLPLIQMIAHLNNTLEVLSVTDSKTYFREKGSDNESEQARTPMPSLRAFTSLRFLKIEAHLLNNPYLHSVVGVEEREFDLNDFPPNLEVLRLKHATDCVSSFLHRSLSALHAVPKFKQMMVRFMGGDSYLGRAQEQWWWGWSAKFEEHGVRVQIEAGGQVWRSGGMLQTESERQSGSDEDSD